MSHSSKGIHQNGVNKNQDNKENKIPNVIKTVDDLPKVLNYIKQNSTHMGDVQLHITTENMSHRDFHRQWISFVPNINNDPETPDSKSKRDKKNDINAKYNDRADDWALTLFNELDKFLPNADVVYLETNHPRLRENRDINSYIRAAYQSLVSKKTLSNQQKESKKIELRKSVKDIHCTNESQFDKVLEKIKDVDGYIRLLNGMEYTEEEKMYDALESFKGNMEQIKVQIERNIQVRDKAIAAIPAHQAGRVAVMLGIEAQFGGPQNMTELLQYIRDFQFAAPSADIRAYAASMVTIQEQIATIASTIAESPSVATMLSTEQIDVLKKFGSKGKCKGKDKKMDKANKKDKRNYSTTICHDCQGTGHYAGKHCPLYKEFLASKKPKL
jgi:hypothetical protein